MAQPAHLLVGQHNAGASGETRNHLAGLGEHLLECALALDTDLRLDGAALVLSQVANLQQTVDEQP